jgi:hypothetical protein
MPSLDLRQVPADHRAAASWAASLLHALARDEAAGRRTERLTESQLDTWRRFKGRLTTLDLVELLFEDAAVLHRVPFDPQAVGLTGPLDRALEPFADAWVKAISTLETKSAGPEYVAEQAKLLGISTRMARSELHVVKPHHKVLELPGSGGQLAHHLVSTLPELTLQDNFTIACMSWQELTLAGVVALELGAPHTDFVVHVQVDKLRQAEHPLRARTFDFVVGVSPERGGLFRAQDQLDIWFHNTKILLV